jgi:hypothetical protein
MSRPVFGLPFRHRCSIVIRAFFCAGCSMTFSHRVLVLCDEPDETVRVRSSRCQVAALAVVFSVAVFACNQTRGTGSARSPGAAEALPPVQPGALRPIAAFAAIDSGEERSRAMFTEVSRVLLHPRCVNCHVNGDSPAQGASFAQHEPPVVRGPEDRGVVGMECGGCHQDRNQQLTRVPGAPDWRLPPKVMAWERRSPAALCAQLTDRERNGNRNLDQVIDHVDHDGFVAWGWSPGADRASAPGTHAEFTALLRAWVDEGAACPEESESHE